MRNISYKLASVFDTTGGVLCPRCEEYSYGSYSEGSSCQGLASVTDVRSFIWDVVLPSMAKKMEVKLGYVREYVLSLSDSNVVSSRLTPAEQRVVDDLLRFAARIIKYGMKPRNEISRRAPKKIAYVYVNNNDARGLIWVHSVGSFES